MKMLVVLALSAAFVAAEPEADADADPALLYTTAYGAYPYAAHATGVYGNPYGAPVAYGAPLTYTNYAGPPDWACWPPSPTCFPGVTYGANHAVVAPAVKTVEVKAARLQVCPPNDPYCLFCPTCLPYGANHAVVAPAVKTVCIPPGSSNCQDL